MTVSVPGDIYRNPVYTIGHYASKLDPATRFTGPGDATDPIARITDDQRLPKYNLNETTTGAQREIVIDRGDPSATTELVFIESATRAILAGHNANQNNRGVRFQQSSNGTNWQDIPESAWGNLIADESFRPGNISQSDGNTIFDIISTLRYVKVIFGPTSDSSLPAYVGEVFLGDKIETQSGIVQAWRVDQTPNVAVTETFAGNEYSLVRGADRRGWSMQYSRLPYDDYSRLLRVRDFAGIQNRVFYFDPPDGTFQLKDRCDFVSGAGGWSAPGDWQLGFDQNGPNGVNSMTMTLGTEGVMASCDVPDENDVTGTNKRDFSSGWLSIDFKRDAGNQFTLGNAADEACIELELFSAEGGAPFFLLSTAYFPFSIVETNRTTPDPQAGANERWYRFYLDLARAIPSGPPASGQNIGRNMANIAELRFRYNTPGTSQAAAIYRVANVIKWNPDQETVPVQLLEFDATQSGDNPGGPFGPLYDVSMTVREVLS